MQVILFQKNLFPYSLKSNNVIRYYKEYLHYTLLYAIPSLSRGNSALEQNITAYLLGFVMTLVTSEISAESLASKFSEKEWVI